jgi:hypothetical protein
MTHQRRHGGAPPLPRLDHRLDHPGVVGNERLTAAAGAVLLILALVEVATVPALRDMLPVHFFVGVLLAGPVVVKTGSTGWRFLRYYTRHPAYRRKGPPRMAMRVLAPVLLAATLAVVGSGIALAVTGPAPPVLLRIHVISFVVWLVTLVIHVVAYLARALRLTADDWRRRPADPAAPGTRTRTVANVAALAAGTIGGVLALPAATPWATWLEGTSQVRVFLLYAAAAVVAGLRAGCSGWRRRSDAPLEFVEG